MADPKRERLYGVASRLNASVHLAAAADGTARFLWCPLGMPEMDPEDWRQWEITPENARKMADTGNAAIARGEELWVNYGHDEYGPRAADVVRFELAADGLYGVVRWNASARAAIEETPPIWKYFSPEWYCTRVVDENGRSKIVNGREVVQPFELAGGALTNVPSMVKLAVAAQRQNSNPSPGDEPSNERSQNMPKFSAAFLASLDLEPGKEYSPDEIEQAHTKKLAAKDAAAKKQEERLEAIEKRLDGAASDAGKVIEAELAARLQAQEVTRKRGDLIAATVKRGTISVAAKPHLEKLLAGGLTAAEALEVGEKLVAEFASGKAPVTNVYEAGADPVLVEDEAAFAAAAKKLAAEKKIPVLAAARELRAGVRA